MAHFADHSPVETRVVLLGDDDTARHREELSEDAARQACVIVDVFGFVQGEAISHEDLTEVDAVVSALGRAITDRVDIWLPFPVADFGREQHWRRLSLALQRHGLNLRVGRELDPCPATGGYSEIDFALRREVQAVDDLDYAALAAVGAKSLGREIERALATAGAREPGAPVARRVRVGTEADRGTESFSPPMLPAPTTPWPQRQAMLKRYVGWLVHGCGVALLNGRYDRGAADCR
jgi:hypothetical protein